MALSLALTILSLDGVVAGQLDATWTPPATDVNGGALDPSTLTYRVYWFLFPATPCPGTQFLVTNPGATAITLTGLTAGMTYNAQVTAVDSAGESACSNMASAVARADSAPLLTPGSNLVLSFVNSPPPPAMITIGETTVGTTTVSSLGGELLAMPVTLANPGCVTSMAINVAQPGGGRVTLGMYSDLNGKPLNRIISLPPFVLTPGWNTVPIATCVQVTAGAFWLVATFDSNATAVPVTAGVAMPFGFSFTLPPVFPAIVGTLPSHFAITATVTQ